jgi:hypothetical protein
MHMKVLFNQRSDQILEPIVVPEDPRIFEDAEESDEEVYQDVIEEAPRHVQVWDDTRDQTITSRDVSARLVESGPNHNYALKNIEITYGPHVWNEGYGWLVEVHGDKIYHVGHKPTDMRCYVLRTTKRRGSAKGPLTWDQPGLPADHPIAKKMIAEVKRGMNFN